MADYVQKVPLARTLNQFGVTGPVSTAALELAK